MADPFAISPYGIDFLKRQEGYNPRAYGDYKQNSIGWGTRAQYPGEVIDEAEAERRLQGETSKVAEWLRANVKVPLAQNQVDALTSAGYNLGTGPAGLGRLLPDINAGNWDSVAARLPSFNKAGGQVNPGLVKRRAAEVNLLTGKDSPDMTPAQMLLARAIKKNQPIGTPEATTGAVPVAPAAGLDRLKQALGKAYDLEAIKKAKDLTAQGQDIAGTSGNALGAIGGSILAGIGGYMGNQESEKKKAFDENLRQGLANAGETGAIAKLLMSSPDPAQQELGISLLAKNEAAKRANPETFGTSANYYKDEKTGKLLYGLNSNKGNFKPIAVPGQVLPGLEFKNLGTSEAGFNRKTGEIITNAPIDVAGKERAQKVGEGQGAAQVDLPRVESNTDSMLAQIKDVKSDPNLSNVTGWQAYFPTLFSSNKDTENKISQLGGQAFLQAFQALKGGGAITEIEGEKATAALARLNQKQSDEGFVKALDDFKSEVIRLRDLARTRANGGVAPAPAASDATTTPPAASSGYKVLKVH